MRRAHLVAAVVVALGALPQAQREPSLDDVLGRVDAYLTVYETRLSTIVAEESYEQRHLYRRYADEEVVQRRRLESDVAFVRLPGDLEWFGFRDTKRVDDRPIVSSGPTLSEVLAGPGDPGARARAMTIASSAHNLGEARNVNMPTVALEILNPRYRPRLTFSLDRGETIHGIRTVRLRFEENAAPTIFTHPLGGDVLASGSAWVEAAMGRVARVEILFRDPAARLKPPTPTESMLRVEFEMDRRLDLMVPTEMRERFQMRTGRGEGRARYRNFRQFTTSARIVPGR